MPFVGRFEEVGNILEKCNRKAGSDMGRHEHVQRKINLLLSLSSSSILLILFVKISSY
ncbi:hypothetical protein P152DRAFT_453925 [Eremomyces bilateralis CBS 781.70]|uniref:Uncharacterized protein n=1 Tax=Eremomyces bilateralis CBS 781.70 TaxID=1392243 RepID=A0A6G1GHH3_9PEZI|nr:uncharacterized protein P152DRAFT_453925 [Eremomyces bilateralis CBS 781.70]KAF1817351.1 hypothetical protein P152DRAFT_453925 [Eremomyces bilateralis CBS 781.70]